MIPEQSPLTSPPSTERPTNHPDPARPKERIQTPSKMGNPTPAFFNGPLRYIHWSARERPAYLWSVVIGVAGLGILAVVPPVRERLGYERSKPIPMTYPSECLPSAGLPLLYTHGSWSSLSSSGWSLGGRWGGETGCWRSAV
jgi:hypothetical protein